VYALFGTVTVRRRSWLTALPSQHLLGATEENKENLRTLGVATETAMGGAPTAATRTRWTNAVFTDGVRYSSQRFSNTDLGQ
jgi:hypothetical protein